ncbi:MAG TPA: alkaline phosphatase family protein [Steroidobacteraceae bacterium]|nr:alkaline phosphatase family protein [Steroidobacteraceae bacterium]
MKPLRRLAALSCLWACCALLATAAGATAAGDAAPARREALPRIRHVFLIVLENEPFQASFGAQSPAPYLARRLPREGALLTQYYAIGHFSLDNYIAILSGQAPNPDTQQDCPVYSNFVADGPTGAYGQLPGHGCIYPRSVRTVADQLEAKGLRWMGYMEDMGNDPAREARTCGHSALGAADATERATPTDQYAAKHDPFVYFHAIIDDPARCDAHVVKLKRLSRDLDDPAKTPNFAFITPNLCHDGHNPVCSNGAPGGLTAVDGFLKTWVPRIMRSAAFRKDGLLVITFDEGVTGDACCGEQGLPGGPVAGQFGPGGGRIGAVLLSPFIRPGTVSARPYNHYSLLRSIENYFGLAHLGYAAGHGVHAFGVDVFAPR